MAAPFETALKRLLRVRTKNLASFNNEAGDRVHEPSLVMAGLVPAIHAFATLCLPHTVRLSQGRAVELIPVHLQRGDEGFLRDIDLAE